MGLGTDDSGTPALPLGAAGAPSTEGQAVPDRLPPCAVDVCFRREDAVAPGDHAVVAVIDVLRATSSIVTALAARAASVHPVDSVQEGEALRRADPLSVLAGERSLRPLPGFDLGNSPAAFLDRKVVGKRVLLATTNGTRALAWSAATGARVLALALLNLGAVASVLERAPAEHLLLLCAGADGQPGLDDTYVAGALLARLVGKSAGDRSSEAGAGRQWRLTERARTALWVHLGAERATGGAPFAALAATAAGQRLADAGYRADVEFCAQVDAFATVPVLRAGSLVALGDDPAL